MLKNDINTIAITGHRPNHFGTYDETDDKIVNIVTNIEKYIYQIYNLGIKKFIVGMAQGVDIWAAESIIKLKNTNQDVEIITAIPYIEQPLIWKSQNAIDRWLNILSQANVIVNVQKTQEMSYDEVCVEMQDILLKNTQNTLNKGIANDLLQKRNEWMVNHAKYLFACWDGANPGGTCNCVRYASLFLDKEIIVYNPLQIKLPVNFVKEYKELLLKHRLDKLQNNDLMFLYNLKSKICNHSVTNPYAQIAVWRLTRMIEDLEYKLENMI